MGRGARVLRPEQAERRRAAQRVQVARRGTEARSAVGADPGEHPPAAARRAPAALGGSRGQRLRRPRRSRRNSRGGLRGRWFRRDGRPAQSTTGLEADVPRLESGQLVRRFTRRDELWKPCAHPDADQRCPLGGVQDAQAPGHLDHAHRRRPVLHHRFGLDGEGQADGTVGRRRRHVRLRQHAPRGGWERRLDQLSLEHLVSTDVSRRRSRPCGPRSRRPSRRSAAT